MKKLTASLFLFFAAAAMGASVGDTYQQVIAEKGKPKSQIDAGEIRLLNYSDATIKIRGNLVVSIKVVSVPATAQPNAAPRAGSRETQIAGAIGQWRDAVSRARNIINQAVTPVPRTTEMRVWTVEIHPGAIRPDFNSVDIRNTQEAPYDRNDYISTAQHPDLAWVGRECEFNAMTKYFYVDRTVPKKKLTEEEMLDVNRLYRAIGRSEALLTELRVTIPQ